MARRRSDQPTDGELEILRFLWSSGPAGLNAIWTGLRQHRPVANTTVATMLGVMLDKGLVTRRKGPRGYLWATRRSREETTRGLVGKLIDRAFDGSASNLVAHLLHGDQLSRQELDEIRQLIKQRRRPSTRKKGR